ncbi:MAG: helix-hairpin-helix domain-containing protein [Prevotella sp.]|nr:helix-hairpin-helix domain-containing protein [Prevotella sp.]
MRTQIGILWKCRILSLLVTFHLSLFTSTAQTRPWEAYLNEVMTQEDMASASWEQTYDLLCDLEEHPMDINQVTREQLEELPFLSAQQIEGIVEYLWRYGRMESLSELAMVRALDYTQRRLLSFFVYVGEEKPAPLPTLKDIARYGQNELMVYARVPFYNRKGDTDGYLGPKFRHWLRYQFTYGDQVKLGFVGSQDAGEPFFANRNKWGYDYYSFYLQLRNFRRLESLVLGNYRVSMGMGLVMNNSFSLGKMAMLQNLGRSSYTLRAHSSRSVGSLFGAAATIDMGRHLKLTAFVSRSPADATLNKDGTVSSILDTDYHRTETEMNKKHNLHPFKTGACLRYNAHGFHLGMNALYTYLDRTLNPNTSTLYRQHYPQGTDFLNLSLDYGYASPKVALSGETATDRKGHLATINTASLRVSDVLSLMVLQRFYSYAYSSLDAQSYSDGGKIQNESGIYLGLTWQPSLAFRLSAYSDYAYFAWAKYQVSQSSYSWDNLLQATWQKQRWTLTGRYRLRLRQKDGEMISKNEEGGSRKEKTLVDRWEHRGRLSADYAIATGLGGRMQIDGGWTTDEWGGMVSATLAYTRRWLRLNGGFGYFHTGSYNSRVYLYELGPLYTYSSQMFYGEGIRYWLMARANVGKHLTLTAKIGISDYFDRTTIGSSYQQVDASSLSDLDLQLRWKF